METFLLLDGETAIYPLCVLPDWNEFLGCYLFVIYMVMRAYQSRVALLGSVLQREADKRRLERDDEIGKKKRVHNNLIS